MLRAAVDSRLSLVFFLLVATPPVPGLLATDHPGPPPADLELLKGRVWHDDSPLGHGSFDMTCVMEYLDARDRVTKTLVLEHRRSFEDGRLKEELLSAREDGKDVTERERRKASPAGGSRRNSPARWSLDETLAPPLPFLLDGPEYRFDLQAEEGRPRLSYAPARQTDGRMGSGWVELDPEDRLPLTHRFVPSPLPKLIQSLVTTVRYRRLGGLAVPDSTESVGEGGLLFIKRRFRVRMTYRDWRLTPPEKGGSDR
jgi:hypothetical protein